MKTISTFVFASFCLFVSSFSASAQCSPVLENFNTPANGTAGFSGTASSGNFGLVSNALSFRNINEANGTFTLTTPTLRLASNATSISYGFTLATGNQTNISSLTVAVQYVNSQDQVVTTTPQAITATSGTICGTLARPSDMITFGASEGSYQLIFTFRASGNGNPNSFFTVDDYRTSSTVSFIVLPVRFSTISASLVNKAAQINWQVENNETVLSFEVEKSNDGRSFTSIYKVLTAAQTTYSFVDQNLLVGTTYYRVKSTEKNGQVYYSASVSVKKQQSGVALNVFPTLATSKVTVQHNVASVDAKINIFSVDGKMVKTLVAKTGSQQTTVDVSSLRAGVYVLQLMDGNSVETAQLVKQ